MEDILKHAEDKKFTDFSNAVKTQLQNKMDNNQHMKTHNDEFERIQKMKGMFNKINSEFGEPDED